MSDKIKVSLKATPGSSLHSAYQELITNPPEKCIYAYETPKLSNRILGVAGYYFSLLNAAFAPKNAELIHSHQQLILNKVPWVIDYEHAGAFVHFRHKSLNCSWNKKIIEKILSLKNCKRIMPWSHAAKKSLESAVETKNFADKIEVVYPAMHALQQRKKDDEKVTLLFTGRLFLRKGGLEALKTFEILDKKYDVRLIIVSEVPEDIKRQYRSFKNIEFLGLIPRDILLAKHFPESDIFLFPTYYDTFGMVFLEAMASSLPIVTLDGFGASEIIEDGRNGFLIRPYSKQWFGEDHLSHPEWGEYDKLKNMLDKSEQERIVADLAEKTSLLVEDSTLRRKMGDYGKSMIENGKFSIGERNKRLERIYKEAME